MLCFSTHIYSLEILRTNSTSTRLTMPIWIYMYCQFLYTHCGKMSRYYMCTHVYISGRNESISWFRTIQPIGRCALSAILCYLTWLFRGPHCVSIRTLIVLSLFQMWCRQFVVLNIIDTTNVTTVAFSVLYDNPQGIVVFLDKSFWCQ